MTTATGSRRRPGASPRRGRARTCDYASDPEPVAVRAGQPGPHPGCVALDTETMADAERLGDPDLLAKALAASVMISFLSGQGLDEDPPGTCARPRGSRRSYPGHAPPDLDQQPAAGLDGTARRGPGRAADHPPALPGPGRGKRPDVPAFHAVIVECWRGNFAEAHLIAEDTLERALQLGTDFPRAIALATQANVAAYTGQPDQARRAALQALAIFQRGKLPGRYRLARRDAGIPEKYPWLFDYPAAAAIAGPARFGRSRHGIRRAHGRAVCSRCRGSTDRGRPAGPGRRPAGSAGEQRPAPGPGLGAGAGRARPEPPARRGRRPGRGRRDSRARPRRAPAAADAVRAGAQPCSSWARSSAAGARNERLRRRWRRRPGSSTNSARPGGPTWARAELERVSGSHPGRASPLTPSEQRVAELAASGLTNREVAGALVHQPEDRRGQPGPRLPQAGHPLPGRTGPADG